MALLVAVLSSQFRHRAGEMLTYHHRTDIWQSASGLIRNYPITGIGIGNYYTMHALTYPRDHPFWGLDKVTAHNLLIHVWAERGMVMMITLVIILIVGLVRLLRGNPQPRAPDTSPKVDPACRHAFMGGWVALMLSGGFQYVFYIRVIEILFWIFLGASTWTSRGPVPSRLRWGRLGWCGLTLVLLGFMAC